MLFAHSLAKKGLSHFKTDVLAQLTSLEELDLSRNRLKTFETDGVCLPSLTKIDLSGNELTSLDGLAAFPTLKDVNILDNMAIEVSSMHGTVWKRDVCVLTVHHILYYEEYSLNLKL